MSSKNGLSENRGTPGEHQEKQFLQGWQPVSCPTEKDAAESIRVGRKIRAAMQQCWYNARRVIRKLDEYADASYVEGWACLPYPIEHGWIVHQNKIIDPTLSDPSAIYFPGLEFQGRTGIDEFLATPKGKACKKTPFLYAFGRGGMQSESFKRCYEQAMSYLTELYGPSTTDPSAG